MGECSTSKVGERMRNEYSKALGKAMRWSEWVGDSRRMTWDCLGRETTQGVKNRLDSVGLSYKDVKTSTVQSHRGTRHYIRIYI